MPSATIEISPPPRSMNVHRGNHWAQTHKRKRQVQGELAMLLLAAKVPRPIPGDRVHATARLEFPIRRGRDEGNYRTALEKALGDALSPHEDDAVFRWLSDDTPEHFTFGALTFGVTPPVPGTRASRRRPARAIVTLVWGDELARLLDAEAAALRSSVGRSMTEETAM